MLSKLSQTLSKRFEMLQRFFFPFLFFNFIALFIQTGHGNKGDEGLFFMISSNLKYCKQINPEDEMFISLTRLKSLVNVLMHQVVEIRRQRSVLMKH